jgi:hypothetical protein
MTERLVAVQGRALTISLDINPSSV